eukprot:jgi/Ulvmu1/3687/UM017_0103.1
MEDWMNFTDAWSLQLLHDLPWDETNSDEVHVRDQFEAMWTDLRAGVMYFMKYTPGQHTWQRILDAQKHLLAYGKRVQQVLPPSSSPCPR